MELHKVEELIALFPPSVPRPDSSALLAELEILADNCPGGTIAEVLKIYEQLKKVLPMANHAVRLICTSPVTVAANERTFSKLKIIKSVLRSTMTDSRLDALLLLSCEKDIVDNLNLSSVVKNGLYLRPGVFSSESCLLTAISWTQLRLKRKWLWWTNNN
jgi:hypothetical protein